MHLDEMLAEHYYEVVRLLPIESSIEVGAFDAEYSRRMLEINSEIRIVAFEASPYVHSRFIGEMPAEIRYENIAISDRAGTASLELQLEYSDQSQIGNNSIKRRKEAKQYGYVDVPCDCLDNVCPELGAISLWIDAEGASREVLQGAVATLSKTLAIFIETEHRELWMGQWTHRDVERFLSAQGFSLIRMAEQYPYQTNCIFVRNSHLSFVGNPPVRQVRVLYSRINVGVSQRLRSARTALSGSPVGTFRRAVQSFRNGRTR